MQSSPNSRPPRLLHRLDRLLGELNVLLTALAIGLSCLNFVVFATITLSGEILRQEHDRGLAAFDITPAVNPGSVNRAP